jgi:2,5-diketo-D-gluconate reductase A
MTPPSQPTVLLNDGHSIPTVGLGVWQTPPEETQRAVEAALATGYRHIDTAAVYGNEAEVGHALAASGVAREDVYVVTKLWNAEQGYEKAVKAFDTSAESLGVEYVDLNLFLDSFKALAHLREQGRVRSIGVSNFATEHLRTLVERTGIVPAVNQIELHPRLPQQELREVHAELGIATEAWSPLGQGGLLDDPAIAAVAEAHDKTPAQVLIRWHIQLGNIVIPKSVNPDRIASNFDVFDFELSSHDIASIAALDDGTRLGPDPRTFNFTG